MAKKPVKLNLVEAQVDLSAVAHLADDTQRLYADLYGEIVAMRGAVTPADAILLVSACEAHENEINARAFANEMRQNHDAAKYLNFSKLAQAEHRAKSAALGRLSLTGDRRGASTVRRAAFAAKQQDANRWK